MALIVPPFAVTIASGQSLSPEIDIGEWTLVGIWMPAAWTAASLTFQVSLDGGTTWLEHWSIATETTYVAAASTYIAVDPLLWRGISAIKARSGTSASPVTQSASATLNLIARTVY
jgi:hypothetical protein